MKTLVIALLVLAVACSDDNLMDDSATNGPAGPGSGPGPTSSGVGGMGAGTSDGGMHTDGGNTNQGGDGGSGGMRDCSTDPQTHEEIINACTDAESVDKVEQVGIWDEGEPLLGLP